MNKYGVFFALSVIVLYHNCSDSPYMQGMRLYEAKCASCHMSDGSGLSKLIPSLETSKIMGEPAIATCLIVNGIRDTIKGSSSYLVKEMPSFKSLSSTEITNIINYINHKWSPNFKESNINNIEQYISNCTL